MFGCFYGQMYGNRFKEINLTQTQTSFYPPFLFTIKSSLIALSDVPWFELLPKKSTPVTQPSRRIHMKKEKVMQRKESSRAQKQEVWPAVNDRAQ